MYFRDITLQLGWSRVQEAWVSEATACHTRKKEVPLTSIHKYTLPSYINTDSNRLRLSRV